MNENRLADYLDHMLQAATDACGFAEGLAKHDFLEDKRTQQAVIMSLIFVGEAATKVMDGYAKFTQAHPEVQWLSMRGMQPHCSRLLRHQPRCGVGDSSDGASGIAPAVARRSP
ncbi:DUF86 domain-containing protein [Variovorax sp. J22R24]|nr:HepT-like ribonuclease domain-containing protein [Variovorax sp. J22R24]MDM0107471.1 DUF86 domain-containing protein [Variovorax sp. J22R24]